MLLLPAARESKRARERGDGLAESKRGAPIGGEEERNRLKLRLAGRERESERGLLFYERCILLLLRVRAIVGMRVCVGWLLCEMCFGVFSRWLFIAAVWVCFTDGAEVVLGVGRYG